MADSDKVYAGISKSQKTSYPVLVPNMKGLQSAINSGVKEISVFGAASETFSQKNINCSIKESLARFEEVVKEALKHGMKIRGYVSCIMGCPYEGPATSKTTDSVVSISKALAEMGCYEISLGDTIGTGNPKLMTDLLLKVKLLLNFKVKEVVPLNKIAVHCHDTYGLALVNIFAALEQGVRVVDSSVAGLGGCPYAPGASGNVCTEDLVYMLHQLGYQTGIDPYKLSLASDFICDRIGRPRKTKPQSKKCNL